MTLPNKKIPIIIALLAAVVGSFLLFGGGEEEPAPAREEKPQTALKIEDMQAQPHRRTIVLYGATAPNRRVELKAETQGTIKAIPAREGVALKSGGVIVEIDERDRRARLARARALLEQRRIEHNAAQRLQEQGFQTEIRLAETKTQLEEARVNLREVELDLHYTKLRAPFDGVLEKVNVELGDFVGVGVFGGEGALATMVDPDPLLITGQLSERDRAQVQLGSRAAGRIAESGTVIEGEVTYLATVAEEASRTFRVEISVPNPDYTIPAGVTAELALPAQETMAYRISPSALALDDTGRVGVKLVDEAQIVRFHAVEIIEETPQGMWVAGLPERIRIITLGQNTIADGEALK